MLKLKSHIHFNSFHFFGFKHPFISNVNSNLLELGSQCSHHFIGHLFLRKSQRSKINSVHLEYGLLSVISRTCFHPRLYNLSSFQLKSISLVQIILINLLEEVRQFQVVGHKVNRAAYCSICNSRDNC